METGPEISRISAVSEALPSFPTSEPQYSNKNDNIHQSLRSGEERNKANPDELPIEDERSHFLARTEQATTGDRKAQNKSQSTGFKRVTWAQKLGKTAIAVLVLGDIVILLCLGLLSFLWFSNATDTTWRGIVVRDWMTQAITIISEGLKLAIGFQIGTCSAMLAALTLERFEVELENAATVALIRASVLGTGAILGLWQEQGWVWRMVRKCKSALPLLMIAFLFVFGFLQVITIVLVSDLGLVQVPARSFTQNISYGLGDVTDDSATRPSTWSLKPQGYPAFAEYREAPQVADGVDDTGLTLRAFLPFQSASA
ncbi:hypothetical protein BT63DRAFT_454792 [Microthyrium microscopicum]|uniref:Uncharacterized protein n=1 Tax=Microthyrium microscopicum TaxID=703497 RepID=A0A6A6UE87_9PEZI|nr:hypothetical protein BT63DRAFT_454792 [Microthyrium microscopicum]